MPYTLSQKGILRKLTISLYGEWLVSRSAKQRAFPKTVRELEKLSAEDRREIIELINSVWALPHREEVMKSLLSGLDEILGFLTPKEIFSFLKNQLRVIEVSPDSESPDVWEDWDSEKAVKSETLEKKRSEVSPDSEGPDVWEDWELDWDSEKVAKSETLEKKQKESVEKKRNEVLEEKWKNLLSGINASDLNKIKSIFKDNLDIFRIFKKTKKENKTAFDLMLMKENFNVVEFVFNRLVDEIYKMPRVRRFEEIKKIVDRINRLEIDIDKKIIFDVLKAAINRYPRLSETQEIKKLYPATKPPLEEVGNLVAEEWWEYEEDEPRRQARVTSSPTSSTTTSSFESPEELEDWNAEKTIKREDLEKKQIASQAIITRNLEKRKQALLRELSIQVARSNLDLVRETLHQIEHLRASHLPVDINPVDAKGYTPLHIAVLADNTSLVSVLLKAGADPLKKDAEGNIALHLAIRISSIKTVQQLLELYPQDLDVENKRGETPLTIAIDNQNTDILRLLIHAKLQHSLYLEKDIEMLTRKCLESSGMLNILKSVLSDLPFHLQEKLRKHPVEIMEDEIDNIESNKVSIQPNRELAFVKKASNPEDYLNEVEKEIEKYEKSRRILEDLQQDKNDRSWSRKTEERLAAQKEEERRRVFPENPKFLPKVEKNENKDVFPTSAQASSSSPVIFPPPTPKLPKEQLEKLAVKRVQAKVSIQPEASLDLRPKVAPPPPPRPAPLPKERLDLLKMPRSSAVPVPPERKQQKQEKKN